MFLTFAALFFALSGTILFEARRAAKRRARGRFWAHLAIGLVLLAGGGIATGLGFRHPTAGLPDPYSNCTWGLGAAAFGCARPLHTAPPK